MNPVICRGGSHPARRGPAFNKLSRTRRMSRRFGRHRPLQFGFRSRLPGQRLIRRGALFRHRIRLKAQFQTRSRVRCSARRRRSRFRVFLARFRVRFRVRRLCPPRQRPRARCKFQFSVRLKGRLRLQFSLRFPSAPLRNPKNPSRRWQPLRRLEAFNPTRMCLNCSGMARGKSRTSKTRMSYQLRVRTSGSSFQRARLQ